MAKWHELRSGNGPAGYRPGRARRSIRLHHHHCVRMSRIPPRTSGAFNLAPPPPMSGCAGYRPGRVKRSTWLHHHHCVRKCRIPPRTSEAFYQAPPPPHVRMCRQPPRTNMEERQRLSHARYRSVQRPPPPPTPVAILAQAILRKPSSRFARVATRGDNRPLACLPPRLRARMTHAWETPWRAFSGVPIGGRPPPSA